MGLTPSAATAADLLHVHTLARTITLKSPKRVVLAFLLCAVFFNVATLAMDGGAAAPGHAWTPGRHISAMPESVRVVTLRLWMVASERHIGGLSAADLPMSRQ